MSIAQTPLITLLFAAALGLVNLWLAIRASVVRLRGKVMMGDGGNALMQARMRSHANFTEYVPMALILMALIEMTGARPGPLYVIGVLLVIGRVLHPFGMERPAPNVFRAGGILLTFATLAALVGWAVWLLLHPVAGR